MSAVLADPPDIAVTEDTAAASEERLVAIAQTAVSRCNWVVGRCAAEWTERYARGRTDADFAALVGLSADQVYQRRRVFETFGDVPDRSPSLKWSHFYTALNWDDAAECLAWADENEATVAEMRAFRRALHGEDLSEANAEAPPSDDFAGDPHVIRLTGERTAVRTPADEPAGGSAGQGAGGERPPWDEDGASETGDGDDRPQTLAAAARETKDGGGDDYAPFSSGAMSVPGDGKADDDADRADATAARVAKALQRIDATLTEEVLSSFTGLTGDRRDHLAAAAQSVLGKVTELTRLG